MKQYMIETAAKMGVEMTESQASAFCVYHEMLVRANKEMNLTRVPEDMREACDRNYLDCLTLLKYLDGAQSIADVGSGAGFPGIPLSIMRPDIHFTLIDALGKRVDFLNSVIKALNLNAGAVHERCEEAAKKPEYRDSFDIACARAVAEMNILTEWLMPFVKPGGRLLALKGPSAGEELLRAENAIAALGGGEAIIFDAPIPGRDWQHKIISAAKNDPTPARFPRKPGIAEKRPL